MKELSLHILDIVQNSIQANATSIKISIEEDSSKDSYEIKISDNGLGMNEETKKQVLNPFFTTKNKKTGLGIPLLKQHAELTGGSIKISSDQGKGTVINAVFGRNHLDRQPLGDMSGTLTGLIRAYPNCEFEYKHKHDNKLFQFSTVDVKNELDGISITSSEVIAFIKELIDDNIKDVNTI